MDELQRLKITVLGVDGWYYINPKKGWIAQDWGIVDFSVDEELLKAADSSPRSIALVRQYLSEGLQENTAFVSFTLEISLDEHRSIVNALKIHESKKY